MIPPVAFWPRKIADICIEIKILYAQTTFFFFFFFFKQMKSATFGFEEKRI